jgi:hypothetical protein
MFPQGPIVFSLGFSLNWVVSITVLLDGLPKVHQCFDAGSVIWQASSL